MKKFLKKLLLYSIPLIFLSLYVDVRISNYFKKSNRFYGEINVWEDIYNNNASCDIAIMGSSTAWVHLNPKIIGEALKAKVYNFGIDGLNFELQYLRYKELLKYNKSPKSIILVSSPLSLEKQNELYNLEQFLPYMLWNYNIFNYTKSYKGFRYIDYLIPLARYFGKKDSIRRVWSEALNYDKLKKFRSNGFKAMELNWNDDFKKAKSKKDEFIFYFSPKILNLLITFFNECKNLGISITLIIPPIYFEGQDYIKNINEYIKLYTDLATKHNLKIHNYLDHNICTKKDLFYNANHLNKKGSTLLSHLITSKLLNDK